MTHFIFFRAQIPFLLLRIPTTRARGFSTSWWIDFQYIPSKKFHSRKTQDTRFAQSLTQNCWRTWKLTSSFFKSTRTWRRRSKPSSMRCLMWVLFAKTYYYRPSFQDVQRLGFPQSMHNRIDETRQQDQIAREQAISNVDNQDGTTSWSSENLPVKSFSIHFHFYWTN